MNGFDVYSTYQAIKLHFTSETYNFFIYNGKTRVSKDTFDKRKDKYSFHKLARKYTEEELVPFFVSNFAHNDSQWSRSLLQDEAEDIYTEWKRVTQSMTNVFREDIRKLMENRSPREFNDLFKVTDGEYPILLTKLQQREITLETVVVLNNLFGFIPKWDKQISDDVIYPKTSLKIRKYGSFLTVDIAKYKSALKSLLFTEETI